MACNCKWCRWLPHNWFCLRGLYWIFVTLFYLTLAYTLYLVYVICTAPMLSGAAFWSALFGLIMNALSIMLGLLTIAVILKVLRKIVHAVAPCCCQKEEKKEEVVVVSSQDK